MSEAKHTSEPMVAKTGRGGWGGHLPPIVEADGHQIAIVECRGHIYGSDGDIDEEAMRARDDAHAILFAAAPAMLAELERLACIASGGFTGCSACHYVAEAGHRSDCSLAAVIAKAKGQAVAP